MTLLSLRHATLLGLLLALVGCSSSAPPDAGERDRAAVVALAGAPGMNAGGNAVSVVLYQLASDAPFSVVPLEQFWLDDAAALGASMLSRTELQLYPEEVRALPLDLAEGAAFVGIAADFRSPSLDGWRTLVPAGRVLRDGLGILVTDDALVLTGAPAATPAATPATTPAATPADSTAGAGGR